MHAAIEKALATALDGRGIDRALAEALVPDSVDLHDLIFAANRVRRAVFGDEVHLCSIVNAKNGNCSEDCKFCAQSARYKTGLAPYGLLPKDDVLAAARQAAQNGASCFGFVISGYGIQREELDHLAGILKEMKETVPIRRGGSLGIFDLETAKELKAAGMQIVNHNLETSRRNYPNICTTHAYEDRMRTARNIKAAGMRLCSGGIFGMGETWTDRLDMLFDLQSLDPESVPLNFLNAIPGTPLESQTPLSPQEILRCIAITRFVLPKAEIRICGGREKHLRDLQSWMFLAGADGAMVGNYLTTYGRPPAEDLKMVQDLGLQVAGPKLAEEADRAGKAPAGKA